MAFLFQQEISFVLHDADEASFLLVNNWIWRKSISIRGTEGDLFVAVAIFTAHYIVFTTYGCHG